MIIVEPPTEKMSLREVGYGDVFQYSNVLFLRIWCENLGNDWRTAVKLSDGEAVVLDLGTLVVPVNGRFILERN